MKPINVLIVDDSAIVRKVLSTNLQEYKNINVVGTAMDPYIAREKIAKHRDIDVILLDIEMPRMDGLTFLKHLMKSHPIPVIIVSSLAKGKNDAIFKAMELGAVDVIPKPGGPFSTGELIETLVEKIISASKVEMSKVKKLTTTPDNITNNYRNRILSQIKTTKKVIVIGASTGGTSALETLFKEFLKTFPPVVTVIHMPKGYTRSFAERLNSLCEPTVLEAENGMILQDGHIYIAPGSDAHILIKTSGADRVIRIKPGPIYRHHRPAIDLFFKSAAQNIGMNCFAVILTGMGKDGAEGIKFIHDEGGYTIAQDESTSIVFGMPKAAIELDAIDDILPIDRICNKILSKLH